MASLISFKLSDESLKQIEDAKKAFSEKQIAKVMQRTLNDGIRKAKTEVAKAIPKTYTVKKKQLSDKKESKGFSFHFASIKDLHAELRAGHTPLNLTDFSVQAKFETATYKSGETAYLMRKNKKGVEKRAKSKRSVGLISVAQVQGRFATFSSAFMPGVSSNKNGQFATPVILARGYSKKGNPQFQFAGTSKDRHIAAIQALSVASMAINAKTQGLYKEDISEYVNKRFMYHVGELWKGKIS
jgi:hypothetical protein